MITLEDLRSFMPIAEPLFEGLQDLYSRLPETRCMCKEPGLCCIFLPEMTVLEAFQWLAVLQAMPEPEAAVLIGRFAEFYLTNPARLTGCPFVANGLCAIYKYRTFGCRSYGLWTQEMGKTRTLENRKGKGALRQMWKRYGVELPADVVEFEIDYCSKVQIQSPEPVSDEGIMELLERVYALGRPLGDLQTRFEDEYHSDFSFLVTSLALGMKKALLVKFAVIKDLINSGSDMRLQEILKKVPPSMLRL